MRTKRFLRDPMAVVRQLRAMPAREVAQRQAVMAGHRSDVLYDVPRTRTHLLEEAAAPRRAAYGRPHAESDVSARLR